MAAIAKTLGLSALLWSIPYSHAQDTSDQRYNEQANVNRLNFSSSAPLIFSSTFGLLQQWSNTFYPYGHSIVPCDIPINTNLYHARIDGDMPPSPEWFAFDAAMSYAIAGSRDTSNLLTYRTTRVVKAIYFDGASAALNGAGNMDSQMLMIWNNSANVPNDPIFGPGKPSNRTSGDPNGGMLGSEYDRADALCAYIKDKKLGGSGWGYEGIVRMNAGFEMIWCDFDSPSVKLVSHFNSSVPSFEGSESPSTSANLEEESSLMALDSKQEVMTANRPPGFNWSPQSRRSSASASTGWLAASANRYGFSGGMPGRGEVRARPDSCGIWTFYDEGLVDQEQARIVQDKTEFNLSSSGSWIAPSNETERSMALQKLSRRRRSHRADHVSQQDGHFMQQAVEDRLRASLEPSSKCSGIDWHQISEEIVLEYSINLQDLLGMVKNVPTSLGSNRTETLKWFVPLREMLHIMTMPYYAFPPAASIEQSAKNAFSADATESKVGYERCKDQYLPLIEGSLADSELSTSRATAEVLEAICRVVHSTLLSVETLWFTSFDIPPASKSSHTDIDVSELATTWKHSIEELMAWLGWVDQWTACNPGCGPSELCWIPMWPISFMRRAEADSVELLSSSTNAMEGPPGRGGPPGDGPGGPPDHGPGGPPYHGPGGQRPGRGYRGGPPGFGGENDKLLWEPQCVNRTQLLLQIQN